MRQMTRPIASEVWVFFQATAQVLSRHSPCDGITFRNGVTIITIRVKRGLRKDRTRPGALQNQSRAVLLTPHQMDRPTADKMHNSDRVAQVKDRCSRFEHAFATAQSPMKQIQFAGHDFYHVRSGQVMASCL